MIEKVVTYLNEGIKGINVFDKLYNEVCEIISDDKYTFPAYYKNKKYNSVIDFNSTQVYHRLVGNITVSNEESEEDGCGMISERTYPVRLVIFGNRSICESVEVLIGAIENVMVFSNSKELSGELNANFVSVQINSIITNRNLLSRDEFSNSQKIDFEKLFIAINYTVVINKEVKCNEEVLCH